MCKNIFITLKGGMIQNIDVSADLYGASLVVIDLDTAGVPDDELETLPDGNSAIVSEHHIDIIEDGDVDYFKQILENF